MKINSIVSLFHSVKEQNQQQKLISQKRFFDNERRI